MFLNRTNNSVLAISAAIGAGLMTIAFLAATRASDRRALEYQLAAARNPVSVVVAIRSIAPGTLISDEDVGYKRVPRAYLAAGFVGHKGRVIGREAVSEIFAGEAILATRVTGAASRRAANSIRAGYVALAVGTDEIAGVAGGVRAGDRVDVFVTDEETHRTSLFLGDNRVLGIGGLYPFGPPPAAGQGGDNANQAVVTGTTVVLELTPTQAGKLTQATEIGKVRLALRATDRGTDR
ncbi:MAG: Flp pilus assembly protein CpaB [Actinomycetota bacterium]|nr:Flp pilus assembly protein CpaB [Actinomycetota bacterium]